MRNGRFWTFVALAILGTTALNLPASGAQGASRLVDTLDSAQNSSLKSTLRAASTDDATVVTPAPVPKAASGRAEDKSLCLLGSTAYEESLPCRPTPSKTNWVSIRWQANQSSDSCEVVHTDVTFEPDKDPSQVVPTDQKADAPLIHGLALASGPIECGVLAPGEHLIIDFPHDPRFPDLIARSSAYVFRKQRIYVSIERHGKFIDVVYHQDAATQRLLRISSAADFLPENVVFTLLADLDGDGNADSWITLGYGGDATQDLLLMSRDAPPGGLLREIKRTKVGAH